MNWNLITKDRQGEIHVNFLWICLLIMFCGFLFGSGFVLAYIIIDTIYNGDGFYIYYFLKEYKIILLMLIMFGIIYYFKREEKHEKT